MLIKFGRLKSIIAEVVSEAGNRTNPLRADYDPDFGLDLDSQELRAAEDAAEFEPKPGDVFELTYSDTTMGNVELGTIDRPARSGVDSEDDSESDDEAYRRYLQSLGIEARVFDGKVKILSVE